MNANYSIKFTNGETRYLYDIIDKEELYKTIQEKYPNWTPINIIKKEQNFDNYDKGRSILGYSN